MSIIGGVQVMHTGRLGEYIEMAVEEKMIAMMWSGGFSELQPAAVPYGGSKAVLHTNPFAMGFPAGDQNPVIIDFATSVISGAKLNYFKEAGLKVPEGCIVDKKGDHTVDPCEFLKGGAHLPFGGHKGYAIMLANEFLGRIFTGSDTSMQKGPNNNTLSCSGFTIIVFKSNLFRTFKEFSKSIDVTEKKIRSIPPSRSFKEVLLPGDIEKRNYDKRIKEGIPIRDSEWQSIISIARSLGIKIT
jgi:hydroxycarboxylate dehydrogenase B